MAARTVRIGLVDFDTSHVVAFTQRLNHLEVPETQWVEGGTVVMGCPGESMADILGISAFYHDSAAFKLETFESWHSSSTLNRHQPEPD